MTIPQVQSGQPVKAKTMNGLIDKSNQSIVGDGKYIAATNTPNGVSIKYVGPVPKDKKHILFGKVISDWVSGNSITLNPCDINGGNVDTSKTITCYLHATSQPSPSANQYAISTDDVLPYIPEVFKSGGNLIGLIVGLDDAGAASASSPTSLIGSGSTADTTSWARGTTAVKYLAYRIWIGDDGGNMKIYQFTRVVIYDDKGALYSVSGETRSTLDSPEDCDTE